MWKEIVNFVADRPIPKTLATLHVLQCVFHSSFAVRPFAAAAAASTSESASSKKDSGGGKDAKKSLAAQEEAEDAITDQIPQRPMGVVEGTSYTVIIIAAIAMAGTAILPEACLYAWLLSFFQSASLDASSTILQHATRHAMHLFIICRIKALLFTGHVRMLACAMSWQNWLAWEIRHVQHATGSFESMI